MARVTVEMPQVLVSPETIQTAVAEAARVSLDAELPTVLGEIAQQGKIPRNTGILQAAVVNAAQPARIEPTKVVADIVVAGEASAYAAVQDLGRRPGKPISWRHLFYGPGTFGQPDGWRSGWVNRARRDWVLETAESLKRRDMESGSGRRGKAATYEKRAAYLLSVSIASAIRRRGMAGKRFIADNRGLIRSRCKTLVEQEIGRVIRDLGLGGDS